MPSHNLRNMNGNILCHAVGCRKHTGLQLHRRGLFCHKHRLLLDEIRDNLQEAKRVGDLHNERLWRQEEIEFRKKAHAGHMFYQLCLENLENLGKH